MEVIWPELRPATREWLIAHNGESVPANIISEVTRLGGPLAIGTAWVNDETSSASFHFSDEVTDWIEQIANGE
jgi:hypothetical protein